MKQIFTRKTVLIIILCILLLHGLIDRGIINFSSVCNKLFDTSSIPKINYLTDKDLTELDSKVIIGKAPGSCYYGNKSYRVNKFVLDKDIDFLAKKHSVDTIIDLRSSSFEGTAMINESLAAQKNNINYINIQMNASIVPTQKQLDDFFEAIEKSSKNVYIHCHAGRDRTGIMSSCYLTKTYHYSQEEAFQKVFDKRNVPRLMFMINNKKECEKLTKILDDLRN